MSENLGVKGFIFTTIPEWILDSNFLSDRAVRLFGVLNRYIGSNEAAWPSRKTLAERCNCSVDSIDRALTELVQTGAIEVETRKKEDGSFKSSLYYLWPHTTNGQVGASVPLGSRKAAARVAAPVPTERESIERELVKDITVEKKTRNRNVFSEEFETLWDLYPKRINKSGAYKAFNATLKRGVLLADLVLATKNYAKERNGQDNAFTLHPATFYGPNNRYLDYLPITASDFKLNAEQIKYATIYDDYDKSGKWLDIISNVEHNDNPAKYGYVRPVNNLGQTVSRDGVPYQLDNLGNRRSIM